MYSIYKYYELCKGTIFYKKSDLIYFSVCKQQLVQFGFTYTAE